MKTIILDFSNAEVVIVSHGKDVDVEEILFSDLGYKESSIQWMTTEKLSVSFEEVGSWNGNYGFSWKSLQHKLEECIKENEESIQELSSDAKKIEDYELIALLEWKNSAYEEILGILCG